MTTSELKPVQYFFTMVRRGNCDEEVWKYVPYCNIIERKNTIIVRLECQEKIQLGCRPTNTYYGRVV